MKEWIKIENWFQDKGWYPYTFQQKAWSSFLEGKSGLVNAPTGMGKTYALFGAIAAEHMLKKPKGLNVLWLSPVRALTKDIAKACQEMADDLDMDFRVELRTGDTSSAKKSKQFSNPPDMLITTPESLHILMARKGYQNYFKNLSAVVVDEWHELMGTKRGVLVELGLSRLRGINASLKTWGISATIGNMNQAVQVLLPSEHDPTFIKANDKKAIKIVPVLPQKTEKLPWAGHLGLNLIQEVIKVIKSGNSTLIFTNTRSQTEVWYQNLLDLAPELAGLIAMHHGSIDKHIRDWVEESLHNRKLKAVVCTSSLDLGVDFRPVDTIVQIGGPKGIARFLQRAGRSGHQPGAESIIYFVPTHALELVELKAIKKAVEMGKVESRLPVVNAFDVLSQYLVTLAVSDGFDATEIKKEVLATYCFREMTNEEWNWVVQFITTGGASLAAYDQFKKVEKKDGLYKVTNRRTAMQHRLSIGTIVGDTVLTVKLQRGKRIGTIEEWFIARLDPGDTFWFAGQMLEFIRVKGMEVTVKRSSAKKGQIPSWMGGRMPLSSELSGLLRATLVELDNSENDPVFQVLEPIRLAQKQRSLIPSDHEFLMEQTETREGFHLFVYPFEGRLVHEAFAAILAYRLSLLQPISFSMAYNDYGFELLSDQQIPTDPILDNNLLSPDHLMDDLMASINAAEMARRKFRDIASISGLVFRGYPGKYKQDRHMQISAQLIYEVFDEYDPDNLLLKQALDEVVHQQVEFARLFEAFKRIQEQNILLKTTEKPSPLAFPIMVDRLRESLSSEKLMDRIQKMQVKFD